MFAVLLFLLGIISGYIVIWLCQEYKINVYMQELDKLKENIKSDLLRAKLDIEAFKQSSEIKVKELLQSIQNSVKL